MLIIPYADMEKDTLNTLLEELVTRDGTDYGVVETSTAQKVQQVLLQLQQGTVCLCFDAETESCNILATAEAKRLAE
jgi:uncharacterized protein YheU (UPF0270 family)